MKSNIPKSTFPEKTSSSVESGNGMASGCSSRRRTATIKIKRNNNRIITSLNGKKGQKKGVYVSKKVVR